jgi:pyruvate dehydrogenase E1 component alpha subunit
MSDGPPRGGDLAVEQLRQMILIREFETRVSTLFENNELPGFVHLYVGQEAVGVGACSVLGEDDYITSTHRGHGHAIAKGLDPDRMMAELFGKEMGYCGGKSGSMHIADVDRGMLGANGIVGAGPPLAVGAGQSIRRRGEDSVCLSFFGEGAMAEGQVHEAMNLAGVRDLPVVFVCENNQYGEMTPADEQHHTEGFLARGDVYGMPSEAVDGMDVRDVYDATSRAVERARAGEGPSLLVCETYRYRGHYEGDPTTYRTDSSATTTRPVRFALAASVSTSRGCTVRGLTTSTLTSPARDSATESAWWSISCVATTVTSSPSRSTAASPSGSV